LVNFVIVIDPNAKRRMRFVKKIKPHIPPVDGLSVFTCSNGDLSSVWAAGSWTPISQLSDSEGVAMIWGDAINQLGFERINAGELRRLWDNLSNSLPNPFDGFHAAFVYSREKGIVVGADLLGLFPLYYYTTEDVLLVGSSPELFRYHESFQMEFNPIGLVGILLTNGLFDGQTLLKGVKRLDSGHLLMWRSGEEPKELEQYRIPVSNKYFDLSFSDHLDLLDQALERAVARHAPPGTKYCLTLSGGLDSRMLGGYLKRRGAEVVALTAGLPTDFEMKCAVKVASTLGFEHHRANIEFENYSICAELKVRWEHLANGFGNVTGWGLYSYLRKLAPRVVIGYLGDSIVGGGGITFNRPISAESISSETSFGALNAYGFSADVLRKLLKPEVFDNLVSDTLARIRKVYHKYSKLEFQQIYCFFLHHRHRFHVGSTAWMLSFGAWPVLPFVDSQVLQVAAGMPLTTLLARRAQKELLCKKFPQLAQLPLDRNFYDTTPLEPTTLQRLKQHIIYGNWGIWSLAHARKMRHKLMKLGGERRYYYRIYDFNSSGWQTIRRNAESGRKLASHLFDENFLKELFPAANVKVKFDDGIIDSAGLKILTGFLLWLKHIRINCAD
jgi:asparagine synthase (glutamine-hydrolysing)